MYIIWSILCVVINSLLLLLLLYRIHFLVGQPSTRPTSPQPAHLGEVDVAGQAGGVLCNLGDDFHVEVGADVVEPWNQLEAAW